VGPGLRRNDGMEGDVGTDRYPNTAIQTKRDWR
jgi:hypothetical protein